MHSQLLALSDRVLTLELQQSIQEVTLKEHQHPFGAMTQPPFVELEDDFPEVPEDMHDEAAWDMSDEEPE